jgi:hypothetical protein
MEHAKTRNTCEKCKNLETASKNLLRLELIIIVMTAHAEALQEPGRRQSGKTAAHASRTHTSRSDRLGRPVKGNSSSPFPMSLMVTNLKIGFSSSFLHQNAFPFRFHFTPSVSLWLL